MNHTALCVGGPRALHEQLEIALGAAEVGLRVLPGMGRAAQALAPVARIARDLAAIESVAQDVDILVWAVCEPSEARLAGLTVESAQAYFEHTIYSLVSTLQACLPGMERRRYGRILALSNLSGRLGDEDILLSTVS